MLSSVFIGLLLLAALYGLWQNSMRARELAFNTAKEMCLEQNLSLLDQTVALEKLRIKRGPRGFYIQRVYAFEYNKDDNLDAHEITLFGVTYKPMNNISFKFETGTSGDDDVMRVGLGYMF